VHSVAQELEFAGGQESWRKEAPDPCGLSGQVIGRGTQCQAAQGVRVSVQALVSDAVLSKTCMNVMTYERIPAWGGSSATKCAK
jgi:hypothetical protein